jgi:hypothetical protein
MLCLFEGQPSIFRRKLLSRRTIGLLFILSIVALVIGMGLMELLVLGMASAPGSESGISTFPFMLNALALGTSGMILLYVSWIAAMINAARARAWGWFVMLLLFQWICLLVYLFVGPQPPGVIRAPVYPQPHLDAPHLLYVNQYQAEHAERAPLD